MITRQATSSNEIPKSLTLDIEGPQLSFDKFLKAQEQLAKLLDEVDRAIAEDQRPSINWIISQVRGGSVHLTLEGIPKKDVELKAIGKVLTTVETGIKMIAERPERPAYFSDRALESAKGLAKLAEQDIFMIQLAVNSTQINLNQHIVANVDEIIGGKYTNYGSVEGVLKAIDLSRKPMFRVYDLLTNKSVRCMFYSHSIDEIKDALEKRVSVFGLIKSREDGEKLSIEVEEIEVFPLEDELPTIEEIIGILGEKS